MKKKILALILSVSLVAAGCATSRSSAEENDKWPDLSVTEQELTAKNVDDFLGVKQYKNLEIEKQIITVTEEDIDSKIRTSLQNTAETLEEGAVEEGDIVNIDYIGRINGEMAENGQTQDYDLIIGSDSFIDGFEDGLLGHQAGETVKLNLTFPQDYDDEELAGCAVVFEVTINSIKRPLKEVTNEWVLENTNSSSVEEYKESVREELEETAAENMEYLLNESAWEAVSDQTEIYQYPKQLLEDYEKTQTDTYESYAEYYGLTYDETLEENDVTEEDILENARISAESQMIAEYICSKESITEDSDLYQEKLQEILAENRYDSYEEAVDSGIDQEDIHRTVIYYCALDVILDCANIEEV